MFLISGRQHVCSSVARACGAFCSRQQPVLSGSCLFSTSSESGNHNPALSPEGNLAAVLERLQISELPPAPPLGGLYVPIVRTGSYIYVSGQPPLNAAGEKITGVCQTLDDVTFGKDAALWNGLTMLATLKVSFVASASKQKVCCAATLIHSWWHLLFFFLFQAQIGSLNQIKRLVKSLGMVNSAHGFNQQPEVRRLTSRIFT